MSDDLTRLTDEERGIIAKALREAWRDNYSAASVVDGLCPAVESILAARTAALIDRAERAERERDELRHNWAHDVSTLEALIVQDEAAFRRLRKAYEDLVDTATTKRLAEVRVELDGAYDLLREAAKQVGTAESEREAACSELAALRAAVAGLADATGSAFPYVQVRELRGLLTDEGDNQ